MSTFISSAVPLAGLPELSAESEIHLAPLIHTAKEATATFAELLSLRHRLELRSAARRGESHLIPPPEAPGCPAPHDPRYEEISLAALRRQIDQRRRRSHLSLN